MKKLFLSAILLSTFSLNAFAKVSTSNGYSVINVLTQEKNSKEFISFEYCQAGTACRLLGTKKLYSRDSLESRRFQERLEVAYSSAGAGVVSIATAVAGFF